MPRSATLPAGFALIAAMLLSACAETGVFPAAAPQTSSMIPEYRQALNEHENDLLGYFRAWLGEAKQTGETAGSLSYTYKGTGAVVNRTSDRLLAGYEAFCTNGGGRIGRQPEPNPGLRCVSKAGDPVGQLRVDVLHATDAHPAELRFSVESGERIRQAQQERDRSYRQIIATLAGNGPSGSVLLKDGEAFEAVRFGRLAAPDAYAVSLPTTGKLLLAELLSIKWTSAGVTVTRRDGSAFTETGAGLTPQKTLVRLTATADRRVETTAITFEDPLRFVTLNAKSKQPRQVRLRDANQLLEVTVSPKPGKYKAGAIATRYDKKEQDAFVASLVAEAKKTFARSKKKQDPIDLADPARRADLENLGKGGACAKAQSEAGLKSGDLALSEYWVCAQYRAESALLLKNGGAVTPENTPLVYLSRAARAPWYNFTGVMR